MFLSVESSFYLGEFDQGSTDLSADLLDLLLFSCDLKSVFFVELSVFLYERPVFEFELLSFGAGAWPTIKTTNDMPIICPPSFDALNFVPFQINPHYIHGNPPGHNGETREQRLKEFLELNSKITAVGLREGTMLKIDAQKINLIGAHPARIFKHQQAFYELTANEDFSFLM